MLGAMAGDIAGSVYEANPIKSKSFDLFSAESTFTDDTVLTIAVAEALLTGADYAPVLRRYFRDHPDRGYGLGFRRWAASDDADPYYSYGNGSAMRVSAVGWARDTLDDTLSEARRSAEISHNHEEGIKGAQAVAGAVFLARRGAGKDAIRTFVQTRFGYDLERSLDVIRLDYSFDVSCQGSVPEAIIAFLEATDVEDAIRNAISLGGDSDTMGAMAGAVAEAHFGGVPDWIREQVLHRIPAGFRTVAARFEREYIS